jgi:hypothetical protein
MIPNIALTFEGSNSARQDYLRFFDFGAIPFSRVPVP